MGCCYTMCASCYLRVHDVPRRLSKNVLTCDTQVCTLGHVDNEHRRKNMSEINMNDAPEGYIAVKPMVYLSNGNGSCYGCDFYRDACLYVCLAHYRADRQDVIFKVIE